jgi:hypothetical protein
MPTDPTIEEAFRISKDPEHDYDHQELLIGHETNTDEPYQTTWLLARGLPLSKKGGALRKLAHLEIQTLGAIFSVRDLRPRDLEKLADFLIDYAHRMRKFD